MGRPQALQWSHPDPDLVLPLCDLDLGQVSHPTSQSLFTLIWY